VDPFAVIIFGIVGALIVFVLLLGRFHPRSSTDILDWRPTRSAEVEAQNEIDDVEQMLEATNERRRRRGESELTEDMLHQRVQEDRETQRRLRDDYLAGQEVRQMLEVKNERRRRRGQPEITEEQFRAEIESERGPGKAS
jgi:hypothetical protein